MVTRTKHSGLGKGLGELFRPTEESDESHDDSFAALADGSTFQDVPVAEIRPNPKQPRQVFDEDSMAELVDSIQEVGILQPVVVRPIDGGYELIMGERRWRATQRAGLDTIPAIIRGTADDALLRDALLENLHRAQLNPLEEAAAYQQMLEDFACTQDELSRRVKRSRPQIANTIRLLRLPGSVQRKVAAGVISAGHARALLTLDDPGAQERLAERIVAEGLSVRSTEELVALGESGSRPRVARRRREPSDLALRLTQDLSDHFDTRVKVDIGKHRGRITIEFAGEDDLERVLAVLHGDDISS